MFNEATPSQAYDALQNQPDAQIIDCRTMAEWNLIGTPDLSALDKEVVKIEWQDRDGQPNKAFVDVVTDHLDRQMPIYILCRSGPRSTAACTALAETGFTNLFNVTGGFEGGIDDTGHRATITGWKFEGLPWRQP